MGMSIPSPAGIVKRAVGNFMFLRGYSAKNSGEECRIVGRSGG